jgi:hypothetical protein
VDFFDLRASEPQRLTLVDSTVSRKNFTTVKNFIEEPESREQCLALEDNVKEFGLTYFGMTDRRQGLFSVYALDVCLVLRLVRRYRARYRPRTRVYCPFK